MPACPPCQGYHCRECFPEDWPGTHANPPRPYDGQRIPQSRAEAEGAAWWPVRNVPR
jgi:hypothetical protein